MVVESGGSLLIAAPALPPAGAAISGSLVEIQLEIPLENTLLVERTADFFRLVDWLVAMFQLLAIRRCLRMRPSDPL